MDISATFKADVLEFQRQLAQVTSVFAQGPPKPIRPSSALLFACDYCAGVSNGLSCVHCGAPRRATTAATFDATTASDAQPVHLRPTEPQNRMVRG